MRRAAALLSWLALFGAACSGRPATQAECEEIFGRIVRLEVEERGFRDPEIVRRKIEEYSQRYASELRRCVGKPLPPKAMECVRTVESTEKLSHECLR